MDLFLRNFLQLLLLAVTALVFARVILSWIDPRGSNRVSAFIIAMTEPMLAPIRRVLPSTGMIDFSPTILLIALFLLMRYHLTATELRFAVRLTPRAARDRVDGVVDGSLRCHVTAPPVEGAANVALLRLLARELGLPRGAVRLAGGATGRVKIVAVEGPTADELLARWPGLAV